MTDVTQILNAIEHGDPTAADQLLPLVYEDLRKLAAAKLASEKPGQTLQPTVLLHDAYLRLVDVENPQEWNGRRHFFAAAAEAMRRILIERARNKKSLKHGGNRKQQILDSQIAAPEERNENDLLDVDVALTQFERDFPDKSQVVKLKYFVGLTIPEISDALGISTATVERQWRFARAWLKAFLDD